MAVVAANGRVANKVIIEAVSRGYEVTAFGRGENNTQAQTYIKKDIFDLTKEELAGFDVVVDADYAIALVDEATKGNHIQERISVVRK